ncbi:SAM-dependent methyltransferase, partial [Mycobacterium kansasii]
RAKAHHLNSVHGVYLRDEVRTLGRDLLGFAALNSVTVLHAEIVGRSYGGGILKIEPREADRWLVPSPDLVVARADE